jgi:heme exporter protein C
VNIPIIKYSVEWWNTLHQGATVSKLGKPSMSLDMLWPFIISFIGFAFLVSVIICIRFRSEILSRNAMRPWVKVLVSTYHKLPNVSVSSNRKEST